MGSSQPGMQPCLATSELKGTDGVQLQLSRLPSPPIKKQALQQTGMQLLIARPPHPARLLVIGKKNIPRDTETPQWLLKGSP